MLGRRARRPASSVRLASGNRNIPTQSAMQECDRPNSAYMLFYERAEPEAVGGAAAPGSAAQQAEQGQLGGAAVAGTGAQAQPVPGAPMAVDTPVPTPEVGMLGAAVSGTAGAAGTAGAGQSSEGGVQPMALSPAASLSEQAAGQQPDAAPGSGGGEQPPAPQGMQQQGGGLAGAAGARNLQAALPVGAYGMPRQLYEAILYSNLRQLSQMQLLSVSLATQLPNATAFAAPTAVAACAARQCGWPCVAVSLPRRVAWAPRLLAAPSSDAYERLTFCTRGSCSLPCSRPADGVLPVHVEPERQAGGGGPGWHSAQSGQARTHQQPGSNGAERGQRKRQRRRRGRVRRVHAGGANQPARVSAPLAACRVWGVRVRARRARSSGDWCGSAAGSTLVRSWTDRHSHLVTARLPGLVPCRGDLHAVIADVALLCLDYSLRVRSCAAAPGLFELMVWALLLCRPRRQHLANAPGRGQLAPCHKLGCSLTLTAHLLTHPHPPS